MPHVILEYSKQMGDSIDIQKLLENLHSALADSGIDQARIKTRAIALENAVVGFQKGLGSMAHLTLLLLAGRNDEQKKRYADPLYQKLLETIKPKFPDCAITLEIRDMNPETYYK